MVARDLIDFLNLRRRIESKSVLCGAVVDLLQLTAIDYDFVTFRASTIALAVVNVLCVKLHILPCGEINENIAIVWGDRFPATEYEACIQLCASKYEQAIYEYLMQYILATIGSD